MHDYYDGLKKGIMADREVIRSLTLQSKIQGDYHEALVRDLVKKHSGEVHGKTVNI